MATQKRIYLVTVGDKKRLVRGTHPSPVVSFVSRDLIKVSIPTQDELIECAKAGVLPEDINTQPEQLPLEGGA